jgi:hypothetical protein
MIPCGCTPTPSDLLTSFLATRRETLMLVHTSSLRLFSRYALPALVLSACGPGGTPPPPPIRVWLDPDARNSNVAASGPVHVLFWDIVGRPIELDGVTTRFVRWPEGDEVPATAVVGPHSDPIYRGTLTRVTFTPRATLEPRWYAAIVTPAPMSPMALFPDGRGVSRADRSMLLPFRVGSSPSVAGIELCPPTPAKPYTQVRFTFSELVRTNPQLLSAIVVRRAGTSAALPCPPLDSLGSDANSLRLACPMELYPAPVSVTITGSGVVATSGATLDQPTLGPNPTLDSTYSTSFVEDGCTRIVPPIG